MAELGCMLSDERQDVQRTIQAHPGPDSIGCHGSSSAMLFGLPPSDGTGELEG